MAKRGTLTHRRTRRLAALLGVPPPCAMGIMEALWHVTAASAPAGDIGRLSDEDIADEMHWPTSAPDAPGDLVEALVSAGVLEQHPVHRLVVHGWSEHADSTLRHKLKRAGKTFWDGSPPFGHSKPPTDDASSATDHDPTPTGHAVTPTDADKACRDKNLPAVSVSEPSPSPAPAPVPSPEPTDNAPPGPPASAGGIGGAGKVYKPGDRMPDGREVLDVDELARPVVVRRSAEHAPQLTATAEDAVRRIVAFAAKIGYRFDRAQRRRLRERLLGGETETQILAPYRRQAEELEALDQAWIEGQAHEEPASGDEDLDQALRLAGPPAAPPQARPRPPEAQP